MWHHTHGLPQASSVHEHVLRHWVLCYSKKVAGGNSHHWKALPQPPQTWASTYTSKLLSLHTASPSSLGKAGTYSY